MKILVGGLGRHPGMVYQSILEPYPRPIKQEDTKMTMRVIWSSEGGKGIPTMKISQVQAMCKEGEYFFNLLSCLSNNVEAHTPGDLIVLKAS